MGKYIKTQFKLLSVLVLVACVGVGLYFGTGRIASFAINQFTDIRFSYDIWTGNPFASSVLDGVRAGIKGSDISVTAGKLFLDIDLSGSLKQRGLKLGCDMREVSFSLGAEEGAAARDVLSVSLGPGQLYKTVRFDLSLYGKTIDVSSFKADSDTIRMQGSCQFKKDSLVIDIDLKISFSPEMAGSFPDVVRDNALSPDKDGWYTTEVKYKGNILLLRALFSLAM